MSFECVIVGSGPVGLWSAIQILKRTPTASVTLYEKHSTYQRSHVLRLDHGQCFYTQNKTITSTSKNFIKM